MNNDFDDGVNMRIADHDTVDPETLTGNARAIAWTHRLVRQLDERAPQIELLRRYRRARHPLAFCATQEWQETFGRDFGHVVDNWCALVAEAPVDRMPVLGFRIGRDEEADGRAREIWEDNGLDAEQYLVHDEAISTGYSYVLTWPDPDTGETVISVEDPLHTIVEYDTRGRRRALAGLKRWKGRSGAWEAQLWTRGETWTLRDSRDGWQVLEEEIDKNPLGVVPIIEFLNDPDVYGCGHGDFETILPLQDLINKLFGDMAIASEFAAFPQRVLLGADVPTDEEGKPRDDLRGGITRWLTFEATRSDEDGEAQVPKIYELRAANLANYTDQIQEIVLHIAAITKTPPHYILGKLVNVSGDALKAAETALVKRVRRKMDRWRHSWREVMRLALVLEGDARAGDRIETLWGDPEIVSEAQRVDALSKLGSREISVPREALWEMVPGHTPGRQDRWRKMAFRQARSDGLSLGVAPNGADVEDTAEEEGDKAPAAFAA